jgi:hypothetical protein
LRQDDALAAALLIIVLEKVTRNIETNLNGTIFNRMRQYIVHADDVLIFGQSVRAIEGAVID